jgi:very-short-patch-repair endonuclease
VRPQFATYQDLRGDGMSRRAIRAALSGGQLIRVRRNHYIAPDTEKNYERAAELGGRLDCVSLLAALGVFVRESSHLHVQMTRGASRTPQPPEDVVRHWRETSAEPRELGADIVEALARAVQCQVPRDAIATLDSAWHLGLVGEVEIASVFARLPRRFHVLRSHLDSRAEAGSETLARLLLRALGCHVDVQVRIDGVGRVDLVVDGWLIIECDSRAHHSSVEQQVKDRRRDLAAARRGYATLRVLAEDILWHPEDVLEALRALLASRAMR